MIGWVKLHRKILGSNMYKSLNSKQRDVMMAVLLMVNFEENDWEWEGEVFKCKPGQRVTSLKRIADLCGCDVKVQSVRTALLKLEKWGFLTNVSTKTGRLITVVNWDRYQSQGEGANKDTNRQLTKDQQSPNKELTTIKERRELEERKEEYILSENSDHAQRENGNLGNSNTGCDSNNLNPNADYRDRIEGDKDIVLGDTGRNSVPPQADRGLPGENIITTQGQNGNLDSNKPGDIIHSAHDSNNDHLESWRGGEIQRRPRERCAFAENEDGQYNGGITQGQLNEELDQSETGAMGFEEGDDGRRENRNGSVIAAGGGSRSSSKYQCGSPKTNQGMGDNPRQGIDEPGHAAAGGEFGTYDSRPKGLHGASSENRARGGQVNDQRRNGSVIAAGGGSGEDMPVPQCDIILPNATIDGCAMGGGKQSGDRASERRDCRKLLEEDTGGSKPGGQVSDNLETPTSNPVKPAAKTEEGPRYRTRKKRWLKGTRLDGFEQFWKIFDDKRSKAAAADSWFDLEDYSPRLVKAILHGARMYAQDRQDILLSKGTPKMAQGWLTDRRWEDYVADDGERKGDGEIDVQARIKAAKERSRKIKEEEARNGKAIQPPALAIVGKNSGTDTQSKGHGFANPALQRLFG